MVESVVRLAPIKQALARRGAGAGIGIYGASFYDKFFVNVKFAVGVNVLVYAIAFVGMTMVLVGKRREPARDTTKQIRPTVNYPDPLAPKIDRAEQPRPAPLVPYETVIPPTPVDTKRRPIAVALARLLEFTAIPFTLSTHR